MNGSKAKCPETESLDELIAMMNAQIAKQGRSAKKPAQQPQAESQPTEG